MIVCTLHVLSLTTSKELDTVDFTRCNRFCKKVGIRGIYSSHVNMRQVHGEHMCTPCGLQQQLQHLHILGLFYKLESLNNAVHIAMVEFGGERLP